MSAAPEEDISAGRGEPLVVLEGVNKWFGDLHVLQDINVTVNRGEVVVVIGPSGSGKSTLCRAINRLETIDRGAITLDGKPYKKFFVTRPQTAVSRGALSPVEGAERNSQAEILKVLFMVP